MLLRRTLVSAAVSLAVGGGCTPLPQGPGASSPFFSGSGSDGPAVVSQVPAAAVPTDAQPLPAPVSRPEATIAIEGRDYSLTGTTAGALLAKHAAGLVGCPPESMTVRGVSFGLGYQAWDVKLVEGCAQRVVYGEQRWRNNQPHVEYTVVSRFSPAPTAPAASR